MLGDAANVRIRLETEPEMLTLQRRGGLVLPPLLQLAVSILLWRAVSILLALFTLLRSDFRTSRLAVLSPLLRESGP